MIIPRCNKQTATLVLPCMKYAVVLFTMLFWLNGHAQDAAGVNPVKDRLYKEISTYGAVEYTHVGCWGNKSKFYPKVDSFFNLSEKTACINYFEDNSYVLKYYSFFRILYEVQSDSIAWNKLELSIRDTTPVDFDGAYYATHFNKLLVRDYYRYLQSRYYYGGWGTTHGISHYFYMPVKKKALKANRDIFKKKKKELWALLSANGMDMDAVLKGY